MQIIVGPRMSGTIQNPRIGAGCLHGSGFVQKMCSIKHFCSVASSCKLSLSSSSDPRNLWSLWIQVSPTLCAPASWVQWYLEGHLGSLWSLIGQEKSESKGSSSPDASFRASSNSTHSNTYRDGMRSALESQDFSDCKKTNKKPAL